MLHRPPRKHLRKSLLPSLVHAVNSALLHLLTTCRIQRPPSHSFSLAHRGAFPQKTLRRLFVRLFLRPLLHCSGLLEFRRTPASSSCTSPSLPPSLWVILPPRHGCLHCSRTLNLLDFRTLPVCIGHEHRTLRLIV
ncbi:hypothetical protein C8F04DRAFT_1072690 [Mycena alexandri]|uniref:Uncharacterized protein n=1 Tax=Mycena alexandri TaxID=1745969 RepID=A0AAD6TCB6_9AGAR|nr:hypothetical protein C8F04DRAFT_1072690 [Mycena alexandri]